MPVKSTDNSQFASIVLEGLNTPAEDVPSFSCKEGSKQNAAACLMTIFSNRLAQTEKSPESLARTTLRWKGGVVNFRNAVCEYHWTNISTNFAEKFHIKAATSPATYVMTAWPLNEQSIHVWVIPEEIVYDALPNHKLSKSEDKRLLQIIPANQRFERCSDSPDLKPFYAPLQLSANECTQLANAAKVDELAREKKSESDTDNSTTDGTLKQRSWIFQANPKYYDIREAVKQLQRIRWTVKQHKSEIHTGDQAFIWVSGDNAGVIARGQVLTEPAEMETLPEELAFDTGDSQPSQGLRVEIEIEEVLNPPVLRSDLQNDPIFRSLSILKVPNSTNFALTETEATALEARCQNSDPANGSKTLSSASPSFITTRSNNCESTFDEKEPSSFASCSRMPRPSTWRRSTVTFGFLNPRPGLMGRT